MAALVGRKVRLKTGLSTAAVGIIGSQNDSISQVNGEIDITDKDDAGYRTLHNDFGLRSLDVTVEGVLKDNQLLDIANSTSGSVLLTDYTLEITGIGTYVCDFWLSSINIGAPSNEGTTFTATFLSSGAFVFTPAA